MMDDELRYNIVSYRLNSARNALGEVLSLSFVNYTSEDIDFLYPQAVSFIDAIERLIKQ